MKDFKVPKIEVIEYEVDDVLTTSTEEPETGENEGPIAPIINYVDSLIKK